MSNSNELMGQIQTTGLLQILSIGLPTVAARDALSAPAVDLMLMLLNPHQHGCWNCNVRAASIQEAHCYCFLFHLAVNSN